MASRGRADWRGGRGRGRGRGRASNYYEYPAAARNYGIGRGNAQTEYDRPAQPSQPRTQSTHNADAMETRAILRQDKTMVELAPKLMSLNIQQIQGSEVLDGVEPDLDQHTNWIEQLSQMHTPQVLSHLLLGFFPNTSDCYKTALFLSYKTPGFYSNKRNSVSMLIIKELDKWIKTTGAVSPVSIKLKSLAFDIAFQQKNSELITLILTIYQVVDEPHMFLEHIKHFVLRRKYREACIGATVLKLQQFFDIKEIIVPLMLQDSLCFVEDYLADNPDQQRKFLTFVDSLCAREAPIQPLLIEMSEVPDIKRDKCLPKIFRKLCTRLMKKFNIPADICPNVAQGKSTGAVKYLLYKKYVEQSVDSEDWDELVDDAVRNDVASQKELILSLVCYNDIPCAVKYALKYDLPPNTLPLSVQSVLKGNTVSHYEPFRRRNKPNSTFEASNKSAFLNDSQGEESWGEEIDQYHQLSLPSSSIMFVDDRTKFHSLIKYLSQGCRIIGIDGEWKPSFGVSPSKMAILQLAMNDAVYIVDTVNLLEILTDDEWLLFVQSLFCNRNIRKLGFGISSDFKMMAAILPSAASTAMSNRLNVVDLQTVSAQLYKTSPKIFPFGLCDGGNGLTDLTKACFGKSLNKTDQFSNWERRPLRESQLMYAALDAYCLLEIYHILQARAAEVDVDLETLISSCAKLKSKTPKSANKQKQPSMPKSLPEYILEPPETPCSPGELAVVVDNMLQGLGRKLRLCGIDVKILQTDDDHDEAAKIAMREHRVLLTSGGPYAKLRQYVPDGMCLNINPGSVKEQVAQVFHAFNVQMTSKDIFSRCQNCNNNRYIKVPPECMKSLWKTDCMKESQPTDPPSDCCSNEEGNSSISTYTGGTIDFKFLCTDTGATLKFEGVIPSLFDRVDQFYVCANCGKVYWVGSHMSRALESFGDMVMDGVD